MSYPEVTPQEFLNLGFFSERLNDEAWCVRWDHAGSSTRAELADGLMPEVDFHTSGSTGESRTWLRSRKQLLEEAALIGELIRPSRPEAVLTFAPPRHVYGALASVLMPAQLGLPTWYRPQYFGSMPEHQARRWVVVAVPWTFSILERQAEWIESTEHIATLHSTAMLPPTADRFAQAVGPGRLDITEVFGSTETGGIAWRRRSDEEGMWRLFDDVTLAVDGPVSDAQIPLVVRSPRLAKSPDGTSLDSWCTDDYVVPVGDRRFRFTGRRDRLVKVNGRRVNLDTLERRIELVLKCRDLMCQPVRHAISGEHIDLLIVPFSSGRPSEEQVRAALAADLPDFRPHRVRFVESIERSETGKIRLVQPGSGHGGEG